MTVEKFFVDRGWEPGNTHEVWSSAVIRYGRNSIQAERAHEEYQRVVGEMNDLDRTTDEHDRETWVWHPNGWPSQTEKYEACAPAPGEPPDSALLRSLQQESNVLARLAPKPARISSGAHLLPVI